MRERGKAKTKGEQFKSEKKLSSAGRQPAVEGTHRKWQNKHENTNEDHRTHSRKQKNHTWIVSGLQISLELKSRGWVNTLVGGQKSGAKGFGFFVVNVDLTEDGIDHIDDIIEMVFQYLEMLKKEGPQK